MVELLNFLNAPRIIHKCALKNWRTAGWVECTQPNRKVQNRTK